MCFVFVLICTLFMVLVYRSCVGVCCAPSCYTESGVLCYL